MRTVVIIEPHPLYRLGLRQLLSDAIPQASIQEHDYAVLEEYADPPPGHCGLLVLSLTSSRCSAKLAHAAQKCFSPERILLLMDDNDQPDFSVLPESVAGMVAKQAPPELLQASAKLVLAGGTCFPAHVVAAGANGDTAEGSAQPSLAKSTPISAIASNGHPAPRNGALPFAMAALSRSPTSNQSEFAPPIKPGTTAHRESRLLGLTPRQYEVLVLLAQGYPMKTVGRALNISVATAKAHTETLYQRLDVHNRNAAVYAAVSRGATLGWASMLDKHGESRP